MAFDGYLAFGGNEIINNERAFGYSRTANVPMAWLKGRKSDRVRDALGDTEYTHSNIPDAPWYDVTMPDVSGRFYGAYALSVKGLLDSTRQNSFTEGVADGGTAGRQRKSVRSARVRALLLGKGEDAIEYGQTWLSAALDANQCGMHSGSMCGTTDLAYFSAEPPKRLDIAEYTDWSVQVRNLAPNPSFEQVVPGTDIVRRNLDHSPEAVSTNGWPGTGDGTNRSISRARIDDIWTWAIRASTAQTGSGVYRSAGYIAAAAPGSTVSVSYLLVSAQPTLVDLVGFDASGGLVNVPGGHSVTIPAANRLARHSFENVKLPSNAVKVGIRFRSYALGQIIYVGRLLNEVSLTANPYFSGDTENENGLVYEWEGTPNASASTAKAATVEVRRNLVTNPLGEREGRSASLPPNGWRGQWSGGSPGSADYTTVGNEVRRTWTVAATSNWDVWFGPSLNVVPGATLSFAMTAEVKAAPGGLPLDARVRFAIRFRDAADEIISTVQDDNATMLVIGVPMNFERAAVQVPSGAATAHLLLLPAGPASPPPAVGTVLSVSRPLALSSPVLSSYFDGNTSPDPDLTPSWTGAENGSESVLRGVRTLGLGLSSFGGTTIQSTRWAESGERSVRFISSRTDTGESMFFARGGFGNLGGLTPGKTYTALVRLHLDEPLSAVHSQGLRLLIRWAGTVNGSVASVAAPNTSGTHTLRVTATVPEDVTGIMIQCNQYGPGSSWWDDLLVVEGEYDGDYFDGSLPAVADRYGTNVVQYRWEGTPNNSPSVQEARTRYLRPQTDEEFHEDLADFKRYLHGVATVSGPFEIERYESRGFHGLLVEFTISAGRPWVFGETRQVQLPVTSTVVMQDTPFNLVTHPSAELETASSTSVARNFAPNPSVEVNSTGWQPLSATVLPANVTGGRSTELAAAGSASYRTRFVATNSGTNGAIVAEHLVPLTGWVSGQRFSLSMWATALLLAGSASRELKIEARWMNGSTFLRSDIVGNLPADGGVASLKSVVPPAGSTHVAMWAYCLLPSWTSGATVHLYADAVSVTNP